MERIVLFDGVCNFCNSSINFIITHDTDKVFRFAPLQSEIGERYRQKFEIGAEVDSVILIEGDRAYTHSAAAIRIASKLGWPWKIASIFAIVPGPARDWLYKVFARNRYRIFGKQDQCMMPTPDIRERFLT